MSNLSQLVEIAEKAIELNRHERDARYYSDALGSGYADFKEAHQLDHIERGTSEWDAMMRTTKDDYEKQQEAKRQVRNAKSRLNNAIRRYRLRVAAGTRPVAWSSPVLVLTQETSGDDSPVDYGRLDDDLTGLVNWITEDRRELVRQAQENALASANGLFGAYANIQSLSRQLTSTFGNARASWKEDIFVATGPNSAIGQQLTQINVSLGTKADASTVVLLQSRVDGVEGDMTAISNALTEVNASVDGEVANATWRMTATAGSGGSSTKISAFARVGTADNWKEAGWFVNVTTTGSQFIVIANQFAIANPGASGGFTYPFVVQNDEVYAMNMRLGTLRFDRLLSNNDKLDIRGDGILTGIVPRITTLEQWQRQSEIAGARTDEKWKNVDRRFDDLDKKIEKVSGILSKIMWLVISGLIMAFVAFVIGGGLKSL